MKKRNWSWMPVIMLTVGLLLAGCASTPTNSVTPIVPVIADIVPDHVVFEGFWLLPENDTIRIINNVFVLSESNGNLIATGIITYTDSQFFLRLMGGHYTALSYTGDSSNIQVTGTNSINTWMYGNWEKIDYTEPGDHPLIGYWERRMSELGDGDSYVSILYFSPFGWGNQFMFDLESNMILFQNDIRYDNNNFSEFDITYPRDSYTLTERRNYVFDGDDLLFNDREAFITGDDRRYSRK